MVLSGNVVVLDDGGLSPPRDVVVDDDEEIQIGLKKQQHKIFFF